MLLSIMATDFFGENSGF